MRVNELKNTALTKLRSSPLARRIRRNGVVELGFQSFGRARLLRLHQLHMELEIFPGDTLVDCGANVGQVTSQFARSGATVHSFEPNPLCFRTLQERFRHVQNVTIHHVGIMDRSCTLTLRVPCQTADMSWETSVAGSFHSETGHQVDQFDRYEVACVDLAQWVLARPGRIRLMKLDIEGSEIPVINRLIDTGAIERIDLIVCETHDQTNPSLVAPTAALRARLEREGLATRVRLDWP